MTENTKDMEKTNDIPQEQRPWNIKPGARLEIGDEMLRWLFQYSNNFLIPNVVLFNMIEGMKQELVSTEQVIYQEPAKPQIEVIKKSEPKIVNIQGEEIKSEVVETSN